MAIALHPKFPIPDRSKQPVRAAKDEDGVIDIGWCDGALSDGRAFRAEMWAQDQISMLTIFFSALNMDEMDEDAVQKFVQEEGLVSFQTMQALNTVPRRSLLTMREISFGRSTLSLVMKIGLISPVRFRFFRSPRVESLIRCFKLAPIDAAHPANVT